MEGARGLAWSHDGHIRPCDLAATNGIHCRREVKKGRSAAVEAAGCHQTACLQSDYDQAAGGSNPSQRAQFPRIWGFSGLVGHRLVTERAGKAPRRSDRRLFSITLSNGKRSSLAQLRDRVQAG